MHWTEEYEEREISESCLVWGPLKGLKWKTEGERYVKSGKEGKEMEGSEAMRRVRLKEGGMQNRRGGMLKNNEGNGKRKITKVRLKKSQIENGK